MLKIGHYYDGKKPIRLMGNNGNIIYIKTKDDEVYQMDKMYFLENYSHIKNCNQCEKEKESD